MEVSTKEVKDIIQATFPDYKKRKVHIEPVEKITFYGLNWSGGSKYVYRAATIEGGSLPEKLDMGAIAPWRNPFEGVTANLPQGCVVVQAGWFCGKTVTATIYVNPNDMPKLLSC